MAELIAPIYSLNILVAKWKFVLVGLFFILSAAAAAALFTDLKYPLLGVIFKGEAEVVVADSKTLQPIEGAKVTLGEGREFPTDALGKVKFSNLTLGVKKLQVTKTAYEDFEREEAIFIGLNKLAPVLMEGTGVSLTFLVEDKITDLPIAEAKVEIGESSSRTASDGTAVVNVLPTGGVRVTARIAKDNFLDAAIEVVVEANIQPHKIKLTPLGKNYFLSNRSGKIDLYQSNLDGSDQQIVLEATGKERSDIGFVASPDSKWIAITSTRDGLRDAAGNLIDILYVVDAASKSLSKISTGQRPRIIGWVDGNLAYSSDNGEAYPNRVEKLSFYSPTTKQIKDVATSYYVYSSVILGEFLLYSLPDPTVEEYGLFVVGPGQSVKKVLAEEIYGVYRSSGKSIVFYSSTSAKWYRYELDLGKMGELPGEPSSIKDTEFVFSPDKSKTAFIDNRDGKNDLFLADNLGGNEKKWTSLGVVYHPLKWINEDYIIFRVVKPGETADYIVGTREGGKTAKIVDVYSSGFGF